MAYCAENNIGISYLSFGGRFLARVYGEQRGNVLLRKAQYSLSDSEKGPLAVARNIVAAKIANSRSILQRHIRNHGTENGGEEVSVAIQHLAAKIRLVENVSSLEELRGYEGDAAGIYFGCFNHLITSQKEHFSFTTRSKRPPLDAVNALMSFVYMLLANDVRSALETTGLDPQVGFLHRLRPGRPSLALDIMEELRAYMADRVVLNLINLRQVNEKDFESRETGEIRISDSARKTVITAYQKRKDETIEHPFLGEKSSIGLLPHVQSVLMARYIRGDLETYPPFYTR
jgi:CRISPR-associated protein Cas1